MVLFHLKTLMAEGNKSDQKLSSEKYRLAYIDMRDERDGPKPGSRYGDPMLEPSMKTGIRTTPIFRESNVTQIFSDHGPCRQNHDVYVTAAC